MTSFHCRTITAFRARSDPLSISQYEPFKRLIHSTRQHGCLRIFRNYSSDIARPTEPGIKRPNNHAAEHFSGAKGFWPDQDHPQPQDHVSFVSQSLVHPAEENPDDIKQPDTVNENSKRWPELTTTNELFPNLRSQRKRNVVDLSYIRLEKWESPGLIRPGNTVQPAFRENQGLRKIVAAFARHVSRNASVDDNISPKPKNDVVLDLDLLEVFSDETVTFLKSKGYGIADVQAWHWILTSVTIDKAVQRYVAYSTYCRNNLSNRIPLFVPLQILRGDFIGHIPLSSFIREINAILAEKNSIEETNNGKEARWDQTSATLLIVRLLRHARKTSPELLVEVAALIPMLYPNTIGRSSQRARASDIKQSSRIYNRFLSLISQPTSKQPLRSTPIQQQAQLDIMRQMLDSKPPIPVNREGYRALVRVQSTHAKTKHEQAWANVKSLSWPPWRKDRLGIEEDLEYIGKESRMLKVIRRMSEAGYQKTDWEEKASVLAGWDTDKSPTIQTRKVLPRKPMMWLAGLVSKPNATNTEPEHEFWTSRITATRTVREAWASFSSYRKLSKSGKRHMGPYQAMFEKLLARNQDVPQVLPGDGPETYSEPLSTSDMVYVETDPPSISELYDDMRSDGIRPAGRLLSKLVDNAESLNLGFKYIKDCAYGEIKIDVLLHPEKYPWNYIQSTLSSIPTHFFGAYIGLLSRPNKGSDITVLLPSSAVEGPRYLPYDQRQTTPLDLAFQILEGSQSVYLPAWNNLFAGLPLHLRRIRLEQLREGRSRHQSISEMKTILRYTRTLFNKMEELDISPDYTTFRYTTNIFREFMTHPTFGKSITGLPLTTTKTLFTKVAYGRKVTSWLPKPDHHIYSVPDPETLSALITSLGLAQDITGILSLLQWMNQHHEKLLAIQKEFRRGELEMRRSLILARIFLEGLWAYEQTAFRTSIATSKQLDEARLNCSKFTWPTDEQVADFLYSQKSRVRLIRWIIPNQLRWTERRST